MPSLQRKRSLDLAERAIELPICIALLVFFAPVMLLAALAVKLQDGGPVLFGHSRIGRDGKTFKCLKFRSMVVNAEQRLQALLASDPAAREEWRRDHKLRRDPRVTILGEFLRRSSIDELPQLINVLRGEMSLVGPRPITSSEAARYRRYFKVYCQVRPGITGLWQVSGRNDVSYRRRVALDVTYAKLRSLKLYFGILAATGPAVLARRGAH
ncbi:sugar transferase [Phenylobacterium montanum]|uniref:Sugar transferase n=1 Tax=Phenylobacterium montanum TaxID=2823693 RepID=A0A975G006_9CAUL|nr:sugar transferase [Caulobacter sp. S6]QUD88042.1 sugar transferase [Caulobacter sp. S6]